MSPALRVGSVALALLALPALADAAAPRTGFEPSIWVGAGGFANGMTFASGPPWAPGRREPSLGLHANLAYRIRPAIALALHVVHQWLSVDGLPSGSSAFATASAAGVLVELHPLDLVSAAPAIDLAIGLGFDFFASARQTTSTSAGTEVRDVVPGIAVPVSIGLTFPFDGGAVGVIAVWAPWWHAEACTATGAGLPACEHQSSGPEHYFFLGGGLRLRLRFVP